MGNNGEKMDNDGTMIVTVTHPARPEKTGQWSGNNRAMIGSSYFT
jgi:hypothetical protein